MYLERLNTDISAKERSNQTLYIKKSVLPRAAFGIDFRLLGARIGLRPQGITYDKGHYHTLMSFGECG